MDNNIIIIIIKTFIIIINILTVQQVLRKNVVHRCMPYPEIEEVIMASLYTKSSNQLLVRGQG